MIGQKVLAGVTYVCIVRDHEYEYVVVYFNRNVIFNYNLP